MGMSADLPTSVDGNQPLPGLAGTERFWLLLGVAAVFAVDARVEIGIMTSILYLPLIWLAFRTGRKTDIYVTAAVSSLLVLIDIYVSPLAGILWSVIINRLLVVSVIAMTAALCSLVLDTNTKLVARELFCSRIVESALDAVVTTDIRGRIVEWNAQAERMFGWSKEKAASANLGELIVPLDAQHNDRQGLGKFLHLQEGVPVVHRQEITVQRADGVQIPIELSVVEIETEAGPFFTMFLRDLTRQYEDATYRNQMTALVDSSYDAIIGKNREGRIISWNHGAERIYGYTEDEVLGRTADFLLPPAQSEEEPEILQSMKTGQRLEQFEVRRKKQNDQIIDVSITVSPIVDDADTIIGYSAIERDVTQMKRQQRELLAAKDQAEEANRARAEFLANVSHELRTPMNAIIGMTELALDESLLPPVRDYIQTANHSAHNLLALLNDILDFSKLEAGKFSIEVHPFDLRATVQEICHVLMPTATAKHLELICQIDLAVPQIVIGDCQRIRQVVTNLISNAIKFTDDGTVKADVQVQLRTEGHVRLQFSIRDTGIGICSSDIRRVLRPFEQADSSSTRRFGGTGLGLAISNELLQLMGSRLQVESEYGQGTIFRFDLTLPYESSVKSVSSATPARSDCADDPCPTRGLLPRCKSAHEPMRILLAEDVAANQKLAASILRKRGHSVVVANNGQEAVEQYKGGEFDAILMDIQMPVMDGLQATAAIRTLEKQAGDSIPIIAMTAHAMKGDREKCLESGMNAYLAKPLDANQLVDLVEAYSVPMEVHQSLVDKPPINRSNISVTNGVSATFLPRTESVQKSNSMTASLPMIDLDAALRRLNGDHDLLDNMIEFFLHDAPELIEEIRHSIDGQDAEKLERSAHSLKSLMANFEATTSADIAFRMEMAGRSADFQAAEDCFPLLKQQTDILIDVLKR